MTASSFKSASAAYREEKPRHEGRGPIRLDRIDVETRALHVLPLTLMFKHRVLPVSLRQGTLILAMANPLDFEAIDDVRLATGLQVQPVPVGRTELEWAIDLYSRLGIDPELEAYLRALEGEDGRHGAAEEGIATERDEAPAARIVEGFLRQAIASTASDIHFEPQGKKLRVRMRVDGRLVDHAELPARVGPLLISRLKVLSNLDIAEKRTPQDGRMNFRMENRDVSFRVSTLPTVFGEKAVLRVLDRERGLIPLDKLGLSGSNRDLFFELLSRPDGLILLTGPTGSGKTSTLYAMLEHINRPYINIITLEDPVEYPLAGINQVQINPRAGLKFASGLRSILRQDPDVIMVGEIRDTETARLAVHAALTGHLVLSTLHTSKAAGAVTRLMDMGVEPFLLAPALAGVVAQRLVRSICAHCREPLPPDRVIVPRGCRETVYFQGRGCSMCMGTGYHGRLALHEVLRTGKEIKALIAAGAGEEEIDLCALRGGMTALRDDGMEKAARGLTTVDEVLRAVSL